MFKALIGNLFSSEAQTLVNTVNCVGVMGKGVAAEFKKRFPSMFTDYAGRCARGEVQIGKPYVYRELSGPVILNFPTKQHWRAASRLADVVAGLDYLAEHYKAWELTSLAMPPLGCGNGGLAWEQVAPLIYQKLAHLDLDVELYAPYGTSQSQLSVEFLRGERQLTLSDRGKTFKKMNPEWAVLVETVRKLGEQPHANPVGRVIFQKISYVLTEMGVDTGFTFSKGSYGPFDEKVKDALLAFSNRNWIQERQLGRMMALKVQPEFEAERMKFEDSLRKHEPKIRKAVDLFSRIKNTQQAEDVFTVLYASRDLKKQSAARRTESDVLEYVLDWKKSWKTPERERAVKTAIRQLVLLRWMDVEVNLISADDD